MHLSLAMTSRQAGKVLSPGKEVYDSAPLPKHFVVIRDTDN